MSFDWIWIGNDSYGAAKMCREREKRGWGVSNTRFNQQHQQQNNQNTQRWYVWFGVMCRDKSTHTFFLVHHIFFECVCVCVCLWCILCVEWKKISFPALSWFVIDRIMPIYSTRPFNNFVCIRSIALRSLTSWSLYTCFIWNSSFFFTFYSLYSFR